jgi:hypothetical protein
MSSDNNPKKKGLKINNQASTIPKPKPDTSAAFNEQAEKVFSKIEEYKQRSFDLGSKFKAIIEDKRLVINKTQINKDIELEILQKLIALANELNTDENQPEGAGGTALAMLLMKMLLIQRDNMNNIEYKLEKIEKALDVLASEVKTNKAI